MMFRIKSFDRGLVVACVCAGFLARFADALASPTSVMLAADQTMPGTVDVSFTPILDPDASVSAIALQPDGRILIGGSFSSVDGISRKRVARLDAGGRLDTSFDPGLGPTQGEAGGSVGGIFVQGDGRIIVGGGFDRFKGVARAGIARLKANGDLDQGYEWTRRFSPFGRPLAVASDEQLLIEGYHGMLRLNADGSFDPCFDVRLEYRSLVFQLPSLQLFLVQPDGRMYAGGFYVTHINGVQGAF